MRPLFPARRATAPGAFAGALTGLWLAGLSACSVLGFGEPPIEDDPDDPYGVGVTESSQPEGDGADAQTEEDATTVMAEEGFMTVADDGGEGGDACPLVDILFVVDDSNSMGREQETLAQSIDGFIAGIESQLSGDNDFHLGVVTTDEYQHNPEGCRELGNLVTTTPEGECGPYAEGNFIGGMDDLSSAFACASQVGIDGDHDERPLDAAIAALWEQGSCNEGFLRDDSLLILVIISDEDDSADPNTDNVGSAGDPPDWYANVVAARGGVDDNVVVLSIIGVDEPNQCGSDESSKPGARIDEFTRSFPFWQVADVCEDDYSSFFNDALSLVYYACSGFTPPG